METHSHIVLVDKDDTLVDAGTDCLTDDRIYRLIDECQKGRYLIGLNSDSPVEPLRTLARQTGMRGPIIAEGGAIFLDNPDAEPLILIPQELRDALVKVQQSLCEFVDFEKVILCAGDVVELRKRSLPRSWPVGIRVIGVNTLRRASFMGFVWRANNRGILEPDERYLEEIADVLKNRLFLSDTDFRVHTHATYGVLIAHATITTKAFGVQFLADRMHPTSITMLGDSMQDDCGQGVRHIAVQNAHELFRRRAAMTMQRPHTAGVCDFLQSLI